MNQDIFIQEKITENKLHVFPWKRELTFGESSLGKLSTDRGPNRKGQSLPRVLRPGRAGEAGGTTFSSALLSGRPAMLAGGEIVRPPSRRAGWAYLLLNIKGMEVVVVGELGTSRHVFKRIQSDPVNSIDRPREKVRVKGRDLVFSFYSLF